MSFYIGFDPGGEDAFGWAVLLAQGTTKSVIASGTSSDATSALMNSARHLPEPPLAIATDSPLFWAIKGDRTVDSIVRKMVCRAGGSSGTVGHVNSLRGACLVQGILVTKLAAEAWPNALITEAHPKALLKVSAQASHFSDEHRNCFANEHERDAAMAAYSAWSFATRQVGWCDLAELESSPFFPAGKSAAYWFPMQPA